MTNNEDCLWTLIRNSLKQRDGPPIVVEHCAVTRKRFTPNQSISFLVTTDLNTLRRRINERTIDQTPTSRSMELIAMEECNRFLTRGNDRAKILTNNNMLDLIVNINQVSKWIERGDKMSMFSNVKINYVNNKGGKFVASGSVDVAGVLAVNFSILTGPKGKFVGLPGKYVETKENGKKWFSDIRLLSRELQDELNQVVLAEFENHSRAGDAPAATTGDAPAADDYDF